MTRHEALNDLITYFQDKLEQNEQALKYYTETRGWDITTIHQNRLGYAPPGDTKAAEYLMKQGYNKQEILSTGAFTKDLRCLWQGRYVFPYLDAQNNPVYAIARCTGDKGGGAAGYDGHKQDYLAGKYAKLSHSKDYCTIDAEPVWGLDAVTSDDDEVYVAEGIADAISLSEHGYTVISPVAKQFKSEDFEAVVDTLVNNGVETLYIIPDMDDDSEYQDLPPGISGALRSAKYMNEEMDGNEITIQLVELTIPDGKIETDLDELLHNQGIEQFKQDVENAIPPSEHDAYDDIDTTESIDYDYDINSNASGLTGLTMGDVLPSNFDGRGDNPIEHQGTKHSGYFVASEEVAYDHKLGVAFNPITYLLCEAGIRNLEDPEGSLSNEELAKVWTYAKNEGYIDQDTKIPKRAMVHIGNSALGYDLDADEYIPTEIYNEIINHAEENIGLDTGRLGELDSSPYYTEIDTSELADRLNIEYNETVGNAVKINGEIINPPELAAVGLGYINNPTDELREEDYARACAWLNNEYFAGEEDAPYKALQGIGKKLAVDWADEDDLILSTKDRDRCERIFQNMEPELA